MELQIVGKENIAILTPLFPVRGVFTISNKERESFEKSVFDLRFDSAELLGKIKRIYSSANPEQVIYKQRR